MSFCISLGQQDSNLTQVYYNENLTLANTQCETAFIELIKTSSFDFESWRGDKSIEWVKRHTSFEIDTWDNERIVARLFFD